MRLYDMVLRQGISYPVVCLNRLKLNTKTFSGESNFSTEIMQIHVKGIAENEVHTQAEMLFCYEGTQYVSSFIEAVWIYK
jgi:hypothetical protein